jgi:hypothetical protein
MQDSRADEGGSREPDGIMMMEKNIAPTNMPPIRAVGARDEELPAKASGRTFNEV